MNKDQITAWAREAGWSFMEAGMDAQRLERFAALAYAAGAAAEREACAKVCEDWISWNMEDPGSTAANAIRARS